jgi:cytoskeletal protein CcmA (bactofilin family)
MLKRDERDKVGTNSEEIIAFLGKGTEFKGVITYDGTVRIDGKVEGEVITKGTLVVGETAVIDAEITAGTVVSGGRINGNITASTKVHLLSPAVLSGSIRTPVLIVEEGVKFNGNCEMGKAEGPISTGLPAAAGMAPGKPKPEAAAIKETVGKIP